MNFLKKHWLALLLLVVLAYGIWKAVNWAVYGSSIAIVILVFAFGLPWLWLVAPGVALWLVYRHGQ